MQQEALALLEKGKYVFLATCDGDQPRVRPFGFMGGQHDGKLWFCTATNKDVYAQLRRNPKLELAVTTTPDMLTLRIAGVAVFEDNREVKEAVLKKSELVRSIYKTADNPVFAVFFIDQGTGSITDMQGNPPKQFTL